MLSVEGVCVSYGEIAVLKDVSVRVDRGEIVGVIGANGAGKSTLLKTISGILPAQQGRILLEGRDIGRLPPHLRARAGICQVPEGRQILTTMSVMENLLLGAYARPKGTRQAVRQDVERVFEIFPRLKERKGQSSGTLSGGEQQMLAIGRALMARPRILLLDEPSMGLAPLMVREIFRVIKELSGQGIPILLVEQNARAAFAVSDRAYVMETGSIRLEGSANVLAENDQVQVAYLGMGPGDSATPARPKG